MLKQLPEAKQVLRSTPGQRISYHGYAANSVCPTPTTVVAFLIDSHISHVDRGDYEPDKAVEVIDYHENDRYEVFARLKREGASERDIEAELSFQSLDRQRAEAQLTNLKACIK